MAEELDQPQSQLAPMGSVFHYTDTAGLLGILSSETLFATDYRYLNDVAETGVIRDLIMPILESEIAEITPKLIDRGWLDEGFYTELGTAGHRMQAESMYRALVRATDNVSPIFVVSFCRHDKGTPEFEHGLLSQWRGYAATGGFAIEFDEEKLNSLLQAEADECAYVTLKSDDVRYTNYNNLFDPSVYKGVAGEMIRDLFTDRGIDTSEVTGRKNIDEVVQRYIATAPYLKHSGFHEEREYRIIAPCIRPGKLPEGETRPAKSIKFRARGDLIIPYIEMFETSSQPFPVKSIIIGPHPDQEKQAEAVRMALESEYIDATVRLSAIPYRRQQSLT